MGLLVKIPSLLSRRRTDSSGSQDACRPIHIDCGNFCTEVGFDPTMDPNPTPDDKEYDIRRPYEMNRSRTRSSRQGRGRGRSKYKSRRRLNPNRNDKKSKQEPFLIKAVVEKGLESSTCPTYEETTVADHFRIIGVDTSNSDDSGTSNMDFVKSKLPKEDTGNKEVKKKKNATPFRILSRRFKKFGHSFKSHRNVSIPGDDDYFESRNDDEIQDTPRSISIRSECSEPTSLCNSLDNTSISQTADFFGELDPVFESGSWCTEDDPSFRLQGRSVMVIRSGSIHETVVEGIPNDINSKACNTNIPKIVPPSQISGVRFRDKVVRDKLVIGNEIITKDDEQREDLDEIRKEVNAENRDDGRDHTSIINRSSIPLPPFEPNNNYKRNELAWSRCAPRSRSPKVFPIPNTNPHKNVAEESDPQTTRPIDVLASWFSSWFSCGELLVF